MLPSSRRRHSINSRQVCGGAELQEAVECHDCSLYRVCFSRDGRDTRVAALHRVIRRNRLLPACTTLYRAGDPVASVYVVRSGAIKIADVTPGGDERIVDFAFAGEPIAFDAFSRSHHGSHAFALSAVCYCELSIRRLIAACASVPSLQAQVLQIMGSALSDSLRRRFLTQREAGTRVAGFLLDLSSRFARRGLAYDEFRLPMLRRDIAGYLDLSLETVSRTFQDLQRRGLIAVRARLVRLIAPDGLGLFAQVDPRPV